MLNENATFLFDTIGASPMVFQAITPADTTILIIGLLSLLGLAWIGRKDAKVWLAPMALLVFLGVVETENYLDSYQRFDQISVERTGVQIDSRSDRDVARFIAFDQIRRIDNDRSGRFGEACRLRIALASGDAIYSVNFLDRRGECDSINAASLVG